ncbi:hypothetical protein [Streptomyces sp. NPDC026092]|uniref:hypothetical protein n=1 Tax=Streptomyces sp. NPDC026092 TaxID=3154797 RepID=UPI0033DC95F3
MFTHRDRGATEATQGHGHEQRTADREHAHHPGHPGHFTPAALQAIQRSAGNAAAVRALGRQHPAQHPVQHAIQRAHGGGEQAGERAAAPAVEQTGQPAPAQTGEQAGEQTVEETGRQAGALAIANSTPADEQAGGAAAKKKEPPKPRYRIQIQTAKNSRTHNLDYWANLSLGHAWVALYKEEGGRGTWKSYGFFPAERVPHDKPFKSVKGVVKRNHDEPGNATSKLTAELTEEQYNQAREFIRSNEGHSYNLATFNCTTFARSVFQAATGESAPGLGLPLLENPNTLQDSIKRRNDKKGAPRKGENISADVGSNSDYNSDSDGSVDLWAVQNPTGGLRELNAPEAENAAAAAPPARPAAPARPRFEID